MGKKLKILHTADLHLSERNPKSIDARRTKDASERIREGDSKEHQEMNRYYAAACSLLQKIPVSFINNKEGKLNETVAKIAASLSKVQNNG